VAPTAQAASPSSRPEPCANRSSDLPGPDPARARLGQPYRRMGNRSHTAARTAARFTPPGPAPAHGITGRHPHPPAWSAPCPRIRLCEPAPGRPLPSPGPPEQPDSPFKSQTSNDRFPPPHPPTRRPLLVTSRIPDAPAKPLPSRTAAALHPVHPLRPGTPATPPGVKPRRSARPS